MEPCSLTYTEARRLLVSRDLSAVELVGSALDRIEAIDPGIGALLAVRDREGALADAARIDRAWGSEGTQPPLCGMPIVVKDNIAVRGLPTTAGSRILDGFAPPYDATAVERLRSAGAVVVGKANLDEFAMGSSGENSAFRATRNPWAPDRVPGGSSGGSAAAVAAGMAVLALGSDTGGSVRQPAGFCGVVGVKPTYGRVSRYGLIAFASSLDCVGVMSRDVCGAAALLSAIAGPDPRDATSADGAVPDYIGSIGSADLKGVTIGVPTEHMGDGLDPEVGASVRAALALMEELGAAIEDVPLPHAEYAIPAYYLVADAEASSNLARYDGVRYGRRAGARDLRGMYVKTRREGFGPEVRRRIMLGTYALSAGYYDEHYLRAQRVRSLIAGDFASAFARVDAVVTPTSPTTAFRLGERVDDPLAMYLSDVYTVSANLAGIAAASIPCGLSGDGLPIGLQIMVGAFREPVMLRIAHAYERAAGGVGLPPGL
jgi:aspartyl-tRNA(Asn)/glutamyl-tRNA(Gln) amidotransferase subunit A